MGVPCLCSTLQGPVGDCSVLLVGKLIHLVSVTIVNFVNNFVVVGFMCWDCSTWRFCPSSHFCMTQNVWQKTKMSRINYEQRIMPILLTQWRGCFQPLHNICNCSYLMYFERNPLCNISNNLAQKRKTKSWEKTVSEVSL